MQSTDQHDVNVENCTQVPYHAHFNDVLTEYPAWSTDTNDKENTNEVQYRANRQDILNALQTDTPVKMPDNRQVLDNKEANMQDRLHITQSLNHRLGSRKSTKGREGKKSGKGKQKCQQQPQPSPPSPEEEEHYEEKNNYYHNENYRGNNRGCKPYRGQQDGGQKPYRDSQQRRRGQQNKGPIPRQPWTIQHLLWKWK